MTLAMNAANVVGRRTSFGPVRRAILGGTFDPPHLAHLVVGEAARAELKVDVVTFMPAGAPWQKAGSEVSQGEHRWAMTELAVEGIDGFDADDREVRRDGWTYTIDTLQSYPAAEELVLVLGADAAQRMGSWHRARDVLSRADVAVAPRNGVDRARVREAVGDHHWLDVPELDISGTMLRDRVRGGRSIRFLVPEAIWRYVAEHSLYAD